LAPTIRAADPEADAGAVAAIYSEVVTTSAISFEEQSLDREEMARRIRRTLETNPWLVADSNGEVAGYALASSHRKRSAYRWSVDISAYVARDFRGRGIGRLLYDELLVILGAQGYANVYAGIALPNPASEALHRAIGMELIGVYERVGFKLGAWWDVAWYGLRLAEPQGAPADPTPFPRLLR
jgi:L-amino acid N-acyltransferase YncA